MFTVGEFAQLAQVSRRLLRYYDEIGLLKPAQIDKSTSYRYYSAEQLPQLNRILALRDLGLSLEQIQRILHERVSTDEIHGMLMLKKAEIEQQMEGELQRLRNIESRLQFIRDAEVEKPLDVVIKQISAQPALTLRTVVASYAEGMQLLGQVVAALPDKSSYGLFLGIWHSGSIQDPQSEVEVGRMLNVPSHAPVLVCGDLQLRFRELPAAPQMATFVVKGPTEGMHIGYSAIGIWAEANHYRFTGPPRELALQLSQSISGSDAVTEIQFPVEPIPQ